MFVCVLSFLLLVEVKLGNTISQHKLPCPKGLAVSLNDSEIRNDTRIKDGIIYTKQNYFSENGSLYGCPCNVKPCIRKCCGASENILGINCTNNAKTDFTYGIYEGTNLLPHQNSTKFYLVHSKYCKTSLIPLILNLSDPLSQDNFYLQSDGRLYVPLDEKHPMYSPEEFCLEKFYDDEGEELYGYGGLICVLEEESFEHLSMGMIISMPFLLLTFIAYALLPDRNLHMKALMIYVINLMLGYLLLVIIQLSEIRFSDGVCTAMGYFCVFFFLVSFFWMNVICIDIWFAFSGLRGFSGSKKTAERKRFFMYCGYAFGMPVLHVLVVRLIDSSLAQNSDFKPGIGTGQCFLKRGFPELLYFYGPMAILITINIILFTITAFKIRSVKKETSMLKKEDSKRHSYENDKQTFNLYLKLLFAMGINWSMEIISWAVIWAGRAPDAIWYLTDFCNAIYGVFIFFIFVFKRSIWKLLKKRYYSFIGKTHLAHSLTMTNTTRVTSYSVTNSSVHENPHGVANDSSTLTSYA